MNYQIIYSSIATPGLTEQDIQDILRTAETFNRTHGITGCLLYYNMEFLQLLEGEDKTVKDLYDRICVDKRHRNVLLISHGYSKVHTFPEQAMKFQALSEPQAQELALMAGLKEFVGLHAFREEHITGKKVFDFISRQAVS